ncbi:MAG: serine hydrolase [Acidobacteria bacterium]|nr:serine hydrolase [Acidobacteriota bacterium]
MAFPAFLCLLLSAVAGQAAAPPGLRDRVQKLITDSGAEVAVAFRTLDGRYELLIDPDRSIHAASTMKVPVMIELFRQADAGLLSLDEALRVRNEFHSIVDGSPYRLDAGDDSDAEVYKAIGGTMTLRQLCDAMITTSSNLAANLLIERLGVDRIRGTVHALGADGMQVLRGVEDGKAFDQGLNNTTTVRGLLVLFEKLAHGPVVSAKADADMLAMLARQTFNDAIPAGVPPGTRVAHKTGTITRIHHDAGIVYGDRPYVLVVLVRGVDEQKQSAALIAGISREVWSAAR